MKTYYEKVEIKTPEDLPEKDGKYTICDIDGREYEKEFKKNSPAFARSWEQWIKWYYRPVEITDADIEAWAEEICLLPPVDDNGIRVDTKRMKILIEGAQAFKDGEIKKRNGL